MSIVWHCKLICPEGVVLESFLTEDFTEVSKYLNTVKQSDSHRGCFVQYWRVHEVQL